MVSTIKSEKPIERIRTLEEKINAVEKIQNIENSVLQLKKRLCIIRKSKCSTDFKRNDFLKKNEAYPLGALRSLKFAYRKLRISLFVELAV